MHNPHLPKDFKERIINTCGERGFVWINNLPKVIKHAKNIYNLSDIRPLTNLSFNYTTRAKQKNGQSIIAKFCLPGIAVDNEVDALSQMQGDGIVKLIEYDRKQGILLLEECRPGNTLATVDNDSDATYIAADIIKKIQKPASDEIKFPTTYDWFSRLDDEINLPSVFSNKYLDKARSIASELHSRPGMQVLLHGDLHHFNIVSAERQLWLAIDPKAVIGPAEYECGAFLRNPVPQIAASLNLNQILANRIDIFAETLGFDRRIILGWGYAQAILACVWCINMKSDDWRIFIKCAEALDKLS